MRILVNQLKNIGDVLLAMPAISLIRQKYPDAWITLMVVEHVAPFFVGHPLINEVLPFKYKSKKGTIKIMLKMVSLIKAGHYDVSISLDSRLRPLILTYLAGISYRIAGDGMDCGARRWYMCLYTKRVPITMQGQEHQSETFIKVVLPWLNIDNPRVDLPTFISSTNVSQQKMRNILKESLIKRKLIVLFATCGTWQGKNWSQEYFAIVIDRVIELYNADCYLIGGLGDNAYAEEICDKCINAPYNICGKTEPCDLTALFQQADLLVSIDTGLGHIAATTNIKIISIFINTNPIQWHPMSENMIVLCSEYAYKRFNLKPETWSENHQNIIPEYVLNAIARQIGEKRMIKR